VHQFWSASELHAFNFRKTIEDRLYPGAMRLQVDILDAAVVRESKILTELR